MMSATNLPRWVLYDQPEGDFIISLDDVDLWQAKPGREHWVNGVMVRYFAVPDHSGWFALQEYTLTNLDDRFAAVIAYVALKGLKL